MGRIAVLGATSGPGAKLFIRLASSGQDVIGIGRNTSQMEALSKASDAELRWHACNIVDLPSLKRTLAGVATIINCSNPAFVTNILQAVDDDVERLISLGSTRLYTKFPDERAAYVKKAEKDALSSGIAATILHPTLIYGFEGNNNLGRIIDLVRWFRFIPLPRAGQSLVQPIHCDDVVACIEACLHKPETIGSAYILAGPEAMSYADFVREAAKSEGLTARIISVPLGLAYFLGRLTRILPFIPSVTDREIQRLLEDKNFDVRDMRDVLGVTPRSFVDGLEQ